MLLNTLTVSAFFIALALATAEPAPYKLEKIGSMSYNNVFGRQAGYDPTQIYCGPGTDCASSCGAGYIQCASSDSDMHCFNPTGLKETCCPDGSGNSCSDGYFCTSDSTGGTWCCPDVSLENRYPEGKYSSSKGNVSRSLRRCLQPHRCLGLSDSCSHNRGSIKQSCFSHRFHHQHNDVGVCFYLNFHFSDFIEQYLRATSFESDNDIHLLGHNNSRQSIFDFPFLILLQLILIFRRERHYHNNRRACSVHWGCHTRCSSGNASRRFCCWCVVGFVDGLRGDCCQDHCSRWNTGCSACFLIPPWLYDCPK